MTKEIDAIITDMVQSVEHKLPADIEESLDHQLQQIATHKKIQKYRWWYSPALAAAVLLMLIFMQPLVKQTSPTPSPINEIRTEFEIKDKNIKIIWFQKRDFQLRRKNK